jgi:hypothetical protein
MGFLNGFQIDLNYNQLCEKRGRLSMMLICSENKMPDALAFCPKGIMFQQSKT